MGAVPASQSGSIAVIREEGLKNLQKHEYKGGVYTPLDIVCYKYWWDPVLSFIPLNVAPNLITIIGFLFALSNVPVIYMTNPTLSNPANVVVQIWAAFSFLFYMMMDAIDGRQARRTKSGSPLGQLLDHGCDSILSGVLAIVLASTLRVGLSLEFVILMSISQIVFFIGQWEENNIGVCRTSVLGLFGTTEYLLSFSFLQVVVLFLDDDDLSIVRSLVYLSTILIGLASGLFCIINVLVNTHKISALVSLVPMIVLNISFGFLTLQLNSLSSFLPFISLSLLNSFLIIQMILSTVTRTPIDLIAQLFTISPILALTLSFDPVPETYALILTAIIAVFVCQYLVRAVFQISNFLNIKVFRI